LTEQPAPRTALITGASAGIGAAFAHAYGKRGVNLVLTARREESLRQLAEELTKTYGVSAQVLAGDLANPETPRHLFDTLTDRGIQIDILINNAGYGVPGKFCDASWQQQRNFITVLVAAYAHMAHLFLPGMAARCYGRIVNVASLAGLIPPSAGHTLYGAAKAFTIAFSESLRLENLETGVHVTALCPGFTYSEFHDVTGTRALVSKMPAYMWLDAAEVAGQGVEAVERNAPVHVTGRVNRFIAFLARHLPQSLARRLARSQSRKFRDLEKKG
jgi:short-subunit dehydrogenase